MITYYGYSDGSGDYYIAIDSDRCDGCGLCTQKCPEGALQLETLFLDLENKTITSVKESDRNRLKYTCASCKPEIGNTPCALSCQKQALKCIWKKQ